jgi:glycosyltransferase involved in cell wall biosynthesis
MEKTKYPLVSVVFITYKRFDKLKETYLQFIKNCTYPNLQLIVADDGSGPKIQEKIKSLHFDKYCLAKENKGMGANQNQGIEAADGEYILHLQDDWSLLFASDFLEKGIELFEQDRRIGLIRFWGGESNLQQFKKIPQSIPGINYYLLQGDQTLESQEASAYVYSDRPHLKRRSVHDQVGLYTEEKIPVLKVELNFCKRFEESGIGVAVLEGYEELFDHTGIEDTFNIEQKKENLRRKINDTPVLGWFWRTYVRVRYGEENVRKWQK